MTNSALCLLGLGLLLLCRQFVLENDHFTIGFSGCSGWSVWLYVGALIVIATQPVNRATFGIVIGFAVAFRAMTVFADPFSSSDIYRYVWDGIVQHAHISPYRYVPGDPVLKSLQNTYTDIYENINRRTYARTIYPPVAQMIYWLVTFFSPTVMAMKTAMIGFECVTVAALLNLLRRLGRPREQILLYCWCPLLVWEIGGAGHVDAAVYAFIALALVFRYREQPALTGLFLGLAVMTKFYPLVLLPVLYVRRDWKMPAVVAAVAAVGYAAYASVGRLVFGFLYGYTREEGIDSGSRFFLLDLLHRLRGLEKVPVAGYELFCVMVLAGISLWAWRYASVESFGGQHKAQPAAWSGLPSMHPRAVDVASKGGSLLSPSSLAWFSPRGLTWPMRPLLAHGAASYPAPAYLRAAAMMAFAMMLLFSPHYPWYVAWLVPFLALTPTLPLLTYLMAFFYLFTTALANPGPKMFLLNKILYGTVALVMVLNWLVGRWIAGRRTVLTYSDPDIVVSRPEPPAGQRAERGV